MIVYPLCILIERTDPRTSIPFRSIDSLQLFHNILRSIGTIIIDNNDLKPDIAANSRRKRKKHL